MTDVPFTNWGLAQFIVFTDNEMNIYEHHYQKKESNIVHFLHHTFTNLGNIDLIRYENAILFLKDVDGNFKMFQ